MARSTSAHVVRVGSVVGTLCVAALLGACSIGSVEDDERPRPEAAADFIEYVREDVGNHDWQSILSSSDPEAYQERVVSGGVPEVQFVAELLGLFGERNPIQEGPTLDWEDLERIDSVTVALVGDTVPPFRFAGSAFLESGETRRVDTRVTLVQGRFVLSPPPD